LVSRSKVSLTNCFLFLFFQVLLCCIVVYCRCSIIKILTSKELWQMNRNKERFNSNITGRAFACESWWCSTRKQRLSIFPCTRTPLAFNSMPHLFTSSLQGFKIEIKQTYNIYLANSCKEKNWEKQRNIGQHICKPTNPRARSWCGMLPLVKAKREYVKGMPEKESYNLV